MARRRFEDSWRFYPASVPRPVEGGIRASTRDGGGSWWARRWIEVLESFRLGARLGRGRRYARRGQVASLEVEEGSVRAAVQGSRARPYRVEISVRTLESSEWDRVVEMLAGEAVFAARLLSGELPRDIERVFEEAEVSLFPARRGDLGTSCSCPDWSNPCKHVAAVYHLLGEEFDRDPLLIFRLRGLPREELLARLLESAGVDEGAPGAEDAPEPLPLETDAFWTGGARRILVPAPVDGQAATPAALPRRLGPFPFWRGEEPLLGRLERIYGPAAARAEELLARLASAE